MWHQAGARAMHRQLRAEGRIPGAEGRAAIERNREARRKQRQREEFEQASREEQNRIILERAAEEERQRVARLAEEWQQKMTRLRSDTPRHESGRIGRTWSSQDLW